MQTTEIVEIIEIEKEKVFNSKTYTFDESWNFGTTPYTIIKHVLTIVWGSMNYLLF